MRKLKLIARVILNICTPAFWRQAFGFIAELSLENGNALNSMNKGKNTPISASAGFRNPENITIGDRSNVNLNCMVWAGKKAKVIIGKDCLLGPKVSILACGYNTVKQDNAENKFLEKDIIIGNDVWLGANVVVLPGVTIGDGAMVGAGTIVTRDIPAYTVVTGVPAKKLKDRPQ